jgi:NAD(P)-dependent dehydrogenase (short-subunit alcohol dehydrogenase family)
VAGLDLSESGTDLPLVADVSDREAVASAAARAESELGPVDVLVSAAGHYEMLPLAEIDDARWRRMLSVHLGGAVNTVAAVLPGMLARGRGTIVTISSELALGGGDHDAHYAAAKGAMIGFTKSLAAEVAPRGIRVNSVAPGSTDTPLLDEESPWRAREYAQTLPLRRIVTADEIAATVAFLVEEGSFFAGQVLSPNAGAVI